MSAALLLQYVVIAVAVTTSLAYVLHRQWPHLWRRTRIQCALPLLREGRAPWVQQLGRAIAPPPRLAGTDACGGCSGCDD